MDIESLDLGNLKQNFSETNVPTPLNSRRAKSANRIRYEAEAVLLRKKLGDLEMIRAQLGLSQRKICQLLFVDPSAWTRWTKSKVGKETAPPSVYRALQWYLALQEKYPALDANFWLATARSATRDSLELEARTEEIKNRVTEQIAARSSDAISISMQQTREIAVLRRNFRLLVAVNIVLSLAMTAALTWLVLR